MFPLTAQFNRPEYVGEVIGLKTAEYLSGKPIPGHASAVLRETGYEGYNKTILLRGTIPEISAHIQKAQDNSSKIVDLTSFAPDKVPAEPKSWLQKILG
jgi:hypothetical protein